MKVGLKLYLVFICICIVIIIILLLLGGCNKKTPPVENSTVKPTTIIPSTVSSSTVEPSTVAPSTVAPSTTAPSTVAPSTAAPSTVAPSTAAPSTAAPSTAAPSTAAPSTVAPSTAAPSTAAPSTAAPSTAAPSAVEVAQRKCEDYIKVGCNNVIPSNIRSRRQVERRAFRGQFPHMVYVNASSTSHCGGTLISEYFVMTTAHCVFRSQNVLVILGEVDLNTPTPQGPWYSVDQIIVHERFNSSIFMDPYNIALLKLAQKVEFDWTKRPACLNTDSTVSYEGIRADGTYTGWTLTEYGKRLPEHLQIMDLIHSDLYSYLRTCSIAFENKHGYPVLCIPPGEKERRKCGPEFGGPFQILLRGNTICEYMYKQIGIAHATHPDCTNKSVSDPLDIYYYLRVDQYIPWIVSKVWP